MKKAILVVPFVLALAGCMQNMEITQEPVDFAHVSSKNATKVTDTVQIPVRTFIDKDGKRTEVAGATCTIQSSDFKSKFVTPANVRFPETVGKPAPLDATCKFDGKSRTVTLHPKLRANYVGVSSSTHTGAALLITLIGAAATHEVAKKRDKWAYVDNPSQSLEMDLE